MRLHVISLPHTQTTKAYSSCAYTEKTRKFCNMMSARGHEVLLYAGEENEAAAELVTCITKDEQHTYGFDGPADYLKIDFNHPSLWGFFNGRVIAALQERIQPHDIICVITGTPMQQVRDTFLAENITVEYGVGYSGVMRPSFRVFESYAWRNFVYGKYDMDGQFYDEVIPNYFELDDFPFVSTPDDYYLFIGRLTEKKGYRIAQDVCERLGKRLIVAGQGSFSGYGEYVGMVGPEQRGQLMSHAIAVFVPTLYVGPFEGVSVEANLCGVPVITTDWGSFTENVHHGFNGWRCRTMAEFVASAEKAADFGIEERLPIRDWARGKFSLETVGRQYEEYFERLQTLWGAGFYS